MSDHDNNLDVPTPGGAQAKTPCLITVIRDKSGSMNGDKDEAADNAVDELTPHLQQEQDNNPVEIKLRTMDIGGTARWVDNDWIPIDQYKVTKSKPAGTTPLGEGHGLLLDELSTFEHGPMYPMVIITVTDGNPTDESLLDANLELLKQNSLFAGAIRAAIGIGTQPREDVLRKLSSDDVEDIFTAHNAPQLVQYLKYVTQRSFRMATQLSDFQTQPPIPVVEASDADQQGSTSTDTPEDFQPQPPVAPPSILAGTSEGEILWG